MVTSNDFRELLRNIQRDLAVELKDAFDQNFERQGFFGRAWQRRKSPVRKGGPILVDSSQLRRSIGSRATEDGIVFFSDLPYAALHNEGGTIRVTARMKRFFWAKYYEARGGFGRKKNGSLRKDKRTLQLGSEAEFWRAMALMKVGSEIKIPKRQFLGMSPEVEQLVREVIERNLDEFFEHYELKK